MIDYITFNEELDAIIKQLQHSKDPKVKEARLMIIGTMQKYEKRISDFEESEAPKTNEPFPHEKRMKENMVLEQMVKSYTA